MQAGLVALKLPYAMHWAGLGLPLIGPLLPCHPCSQVVQAEASATCGPGAAVWPTGEAAGGGGVVPCLQPGAGRRRGETAVVPSYEEPPGVWVRSCRGAGMVVVPEIHDGGVARTTDYHTR